jgi:hypothetical protein
VSRTFSGKSRGDGEQEGERGIATSKSPFALMDFKGIFKKSNPYDFLLTKPFGSME